MIEQLDKYLAPEASGFIETGEDGWICLHKRAQSPLILAGTRRFFRGEAKELGRGRGRTWELDQDGLKMVFRRYYHGGIFRFITGERFYSYRRFIQEVAICLVAVKGGVAVPEPLGVVLQRSALGWKGIIISQLIENSRDLTCSLPDLNRDVSLRRQVFRKIARATFQLHSLKVNHADLHLKNIVLQTQPEGIKVWLLDFDKSRIGGGNFQAKNLMRLYRSWKKYQFLHPQTARYNPLRFLLEYTDKQQARNILKWITRFYWRIRLSELRWRILSVLDRRIYAGNQEK